MPDFARSFFQISYENPFFVVTALIAAALLVVTVCFVVVAVVVRLRSRRRRAQVAQREARWRPLLVKALADRYAPADVREHVEREEQRDFLDLAYRFARRVRGRKRDVLREIAHPFLPILDADADSPMAERRARRIQVVGLLGLSEYLDEVTQALDDDSPLVAMIAARALVRREHPEHVAKVLDKLDQFAKWSDSMLSSLLASLGLAATPALRATLADAERKPWVRATVADALRKLGDVEAGDSAAQLLRNADGEPHVLITASLRLLEQVGRPEHRAVIEPLAEHRDYLVRIHAIGALSQIGGAAATDRLLTAVHDPSPWVAMQAVEGLKRMGRRDALRTLAASDNRRATLAQQALIEKSVLSQ